MSPTSKSAGAPHSRRAGLLQPCRFGNRRYGRLGSLRYDRDRQPRLSHLIHQKQKGEVIDLALELNQ